MEISKKRKRDVNYPRITYEATTKVFDRLFKEESLEEMKNVVRKKLGLSSSLPVHLSQLRDGKSVVLEDDDDFDAFYASVYSTPVVKIKVYFGDDQPPPAGTVGTGGPIQLLESPTAHNTVTDDHRTSKKHKVAFVEPISEPLGDNAEEPREIQQTVTLDNSSELSPNSEVPPEVPATIDIISADAEEARDTGDVVKKTGKKKENKKTGKAAAPTLENQSLGEQAQSDIVVVETLGSSSKESNKKTHDATKSKKRPRASTADDSIQPVTEVLGGTTAPETDDSEGHPRSSKKSKHKHKNSGDQENPATDLIDGGQTTKGPEESQRHTPSNEQADPSEIDVLTRPPKKKKKSRKKNQVIEVAIVDKQSNTASSTSKPTKSRTSIVVQHAKKQDPRLPASTSELKPVPQLDPKGKSKDPGLNQSLNTPTEPTNETQIEEETTSSALAKGKPTKKKSRNKEAPVGPPDANSAQDQTLGSNVTAATRAAVDAILARNSLPSKGSKEIPTCSSPLVDLTAPSPSAIPIVPITSSSSPDNQPKPPTNASLTAKRPKTVPKCLICDQTPTHFRSRCPIIKSGVRAMRQRIAELQRDTPESDDERRAMVIEELGRIIDKRTKRRTPAAENNLTTADEPVISPTLVADSSRVTQPPGAVKAVKPTKAASQKIIPLPHLAESLAFGDVSSYTVRDLEALIRGPEVTLADMPSSDSSEDEEEEVLEEELEEVQDKSSRSQRSRIRYSSSSEGEEEEEASPFVPSIIPLPIKSASELSNEDESSRSEDFRGDITSFLEVNGLGSSLEVDKTGDAAVNDAYALDFAHLNGPEISENARKVAIDGIMNGPEERQVLEESEPELVSDVANEFPVTIATPQSDPIEASEKASSPQSPIVSIEEDIHPLQSTPKAEIAVRTRSQRNNATLVRKTTDLTFKPHSVSQTGVDGVNSKSKSAKKKGGLTRITDLPIPLNPAIRVIRPAGVQTRRQAAQVGEGKEKADEQGPTDVSQAKPKNGRLSASKTSPNTTKTIAKTPVKAPAKVPVPSNGENTQTRSVTVVQNAPETMEPAPSHGEQSLASWAVLQGNSQLENETPGMVDELQSSPDMPHFPLSAGKSLSPAVVNGVSKGLDPLFLPSDSQQSFPYSQHPGFGPETPGSEDEEDEVEASVVKPRAATKVSSKFRSLTEIASQPTQFTPTLRLTQTTSAKGEVMNLYGRAMEGSEEENSDSESESEAEEKAQRSHIPMSRRAGVMKRG